MPNNSDQNANTVEKGHRTLHLTPVEVWDAQKRMSAYRPEGFDVDGFIHCTDDVDELMNVGNRYYQADPRPYLVLSINCDLVSPPVVYDDSARVFPHIYGSLDVVAVELVRPVHRDPNGRFVAIET